MASKKRIGLYGGTFSPPHKGHIHAARAFLEQGQIEELIIIPTYSPPHKVRTDSATAEDRLAMCRLAFGFSSRISVSDLEILRQGTSYTSDTLRALSDQNTQLVLLCGTDMFLTLDEWHAPEVIFALAEIACIRRENERENDGTLADKAALYRERYGATVRFLDIDALVLSSSEVRARVGNGGAFQDLLSDEVAAYVEQKELYR